MENRRINIGLFVGNIEDDFSSSICRGAFLASKELDANLIIMPGKYLDLDKSEDPKQRYEYQYNVLFNYAMKNDIDVLVACIGTIGYLASPERKRELLDQFSDIPLITVASREGDYPAIMYDNYSGLHEAVEFLIEHKGSRKIGMVSGHLENDDAKERYNTVVQTMANHQLSFGEKAVVYSELTEYCEPQADQLLDDNPDLDTIICTNDAMALGVYRALKKRGIKPGRDIKVLGFDDVAESRTAHPPIATVRADASLLGYKAVLSALELLKEGKVNNPLVPTSFVPRESVGYYNTDEQVEIDLIFRQLNVYNHSQRIARKVTEYLFEGVKLDTGVYLNQENYVHFMEHFFALIFDKPMDESDAIDVFTEFKRLVNEGTMEYIQTDKLALIFETAYYHYCDKNADKEGQMLLYRLISQFVQKMMDYQTQVIARNESGYRRLNHHTNIIARDILMFGNDAEQSYADLLRNMTLLYMGNSYLYVFETPIVHKDKEPWVMPESILLKAYQDDDDVYSVSRTQQRTRTDEIFRQPNMMEKDPKVYVLVDLYCGELQYGVFVCDIPCEFYGCVELLTYQMSTAIRTIQIFQKQKLTQRQLEESMEQLKNNNVQLDTIARFDELTGVLNRRGFISQAEQLRKEKASADSHYFVFYADVDHLKQINDEFGHDEGDFAIVSTAAILKKAFEKYGMIGRIGGDEFAGFAVRTPDQELCHFIEEVREYERQLNEESGKPYYINVSIGVCEFPSAQELVLMDMMNQADDQLYEAKKRRRSSIAKPEQA